MLKFGLPLVLATALSTPAFAVPISGQLVDRSGGGLPQAGGSTLSYMGGPILDHVKVFTVYWGKTVNFSGTGAQGLDSFYSAVVQSNYYDWLNEYKTTNQPMLGRGSFIGSYAYTGGATGSIDDSQIQSALGSLIDSGKLPKPDANTLFAVHFAAGISITQGGQGSCQVFCAYHNSFTHGSGNVFYSVVPDQGGACAGGCGGDPSTFNNTTSVSSHELVEATTDPDVGNNDIAWYNNSQGEIGDICNAQQCKGSTAGSKTSCPGSFVVQLEWSNKNNACISNDPSVVVNDFSVAASPTSLMVPAGGMATTKLTFTKTAGSADTVKLSANTVTGLTVSFSPTSASSDNGTSTVTIAADATAMLGAMDKVTVTAAGTTSSHTLDIPVTITAPPDMAMAPDLAQPNNGGNGGNGGGGSGGNGTGGNGTGGNGTGGNGNNGGGGDSGCSMSGSSIAGSWAFAAFVLLALAFRRRRA